MKLLIFLAAVLTVAVLKAPLSHGQNTIPPKVAKEARWLASHGGVRSSRHGDATPRMKQLVVELILARFRPAGSSVQRVALCVARGESGFNPGAISHTDDWGVFQINRPSWWRVYDWSRILDPVYNIGVGWAMSQRGRSWWPWTVWRNGWCG